MKILSTGGTFLAELTFTDKRAVELHNKALPLATGPGNSE